MSAYTVFLEYDEKTDDVILPLPDELMLEAGWNLGDTVKWTDNGDGTFMLSKIESREEKEWVLVECISQFRERYMVEVPKGKAEWALDTVTLHEAKEFSQEHLGEVIVSHRVVSKQEALELCDVDNDYCKKWNDEQKMNAFFTRDGEKVEL